MVSNSVRRNFVGDVRPCIRCEGIITISEAMVKRGKYRCGHCESQMAVNWAKKNREKKRASNNSYSKNHSSDRAKRTSKWRANHPEKRKAHQAVQTAIRNGTLMKQPCGECGSALRIHAHHDDYEKPLEVIWLCHSHHMQRHAMLAQRDGGQ